jgi:hypothetical protein
MTYKFIVWHRMRADKRHNLVVTISHGRAFQKHIYTELNVLLEHFNRKSFRCKNTHPAYVSVNRAIKELKDKCEEAYNRFQSGSFSLNQVVGYIKGELEMASLDEFVDTYFKKYKSDQAYNDYKSVIGIIKGHMGIKGKLQWKDITRDFLDTWLLEMQRRKLSNGSIKSYAIKLQAILNDAEDREIIQSFPKFPKALKTGGKKNRINPNAIAIPTFTSKQLKDMINDVKSLEQWQTMALFTLCFGLRGMYPADIVKMKQADMDSPTISKMLDDELHIFHLRSKTQNSKNAMMYIHINNENQHLIMMLKRTTAKLWGKRYMDFIAHPNDSVAIWDYNPTDNAKWHANRWALHSRRLKKYGFNMKSPRKSFNTFCEEIEISHKNTPVEFNERTRLILLGREGDSILEGSYSNKQAVAMRKAINTAHKYVLDKFDYPEIVKLLESKLKTLKDIPLWVKHQPLMIWENMYEHMNRRGLGVELVNNILYKVYGKGKIIKKGLFMGIPSVWEDKREKNGIQTQKIEPEYEEYWRKFNEEVLKYVDDVPFEEAVMKLVEKDKNKDKGGKVIKLRGKGKDMYRISAN